ncbi:MAG: DUF6158 family protein [Motilibacteraceae bacterium]
MTRHDPATGTRADGVAPDTLGDDDLDRELAHLHQTRDDTLRHGSADALRAHTDRTAALEEEYLRRHPDRQVDLRRTRAGARAEAGQPAAAPSSGSSPSTPSHDARLHDMGGAIGPAPITASSDRQVATRLQDEAVATGAPGGAPPELVADEVGGTSPAYGEGAVASTSMRADDPFERSDGDATPPPAPMTHGDYAGLPDADETGRGADGDTAARRAQKEHGGP